MNDDFELNKLGWFTVQNVQENDFLNQKLDNDQYGIWYSVKFTGDANTHLWQAKTAPKEGEKVYGHIEKTKSGKTTKFRRAKKDDTPPEPGQSGQSQSASVPHYDDHKDESIARAVALKAAVEMGCKTSEEAIHNAEKFLAWLQGSSESTNPKAETSTNQPQQSGTTTQVSGYDKFKQSRPKAKDEDAEMESLYNTVAQNENEAFEDYP